MPAVMTVSPGWRPEEMRTPLATKSEEVMRRCWARPFSTTQTERPSGRVWTHLAGTTYPWLSDWLSSTLQTIPGSSDLSVLGKAIFTW